MAQIRQDSVFSQADSLPSSSEAQRRIAPNVLIVGETGVGKSSVVNLIAGNQVAKVHSGAGACTLEATPYDIILQDHQGLEHNIRLFDTVGINEPQFKKADYLAAIEKANTLICQLQRTGGIRLLLFCIRGGRITSTTQNNYRLFCDILCQNKASVALVVTGLENEESMDGWWQQNESLLKAYGLSCTSHVCVTSIRGRNNRYAEEYHESQMTVRAMLLAHVTENCTSWQTERMGWFIYLAGKLLRWLRRGQALTMEELARHLQDRCKFTQSDAEYLAARICAERLENAGPDLMKSNGPLNSPPLNVILFGETGVGKSSVVNLIAGDKLAETSPDAGACTFTSRPYHVVLQSNRPFCIWDTTGLNEPKISHEDYLRAIKQAYKLIKELERSGGVHLLLLCMRGRITESVQRNYNLFFKVLCEKKIPLCIIVTNLENEPCMEGWWTANEQVFKRYGITSDGHACITASPGVGDVFRDRYKESRERMHRLLLDSEVKVSRESLKFSLRYRHNNQPTTSTRGLMKKLVNECGFSKKEATAIATSIEVIRQLTPSSDEGPL